MKGSVKVKFDFGWALSLILAILIVVGCAARLSFTYSVQEKAQAICDVTAMQSAVAYDKDDPVFNYKNFYDSCAVVNIKPNLEVLMDLDSWTYRDVYPTHRLSKFQKMD